jgi:hypothetical protein
VVQVEADIIARLAYLALAVQVLLPSVMSISASSARIELPWRRRTVLITILSRLRRRSRAVSADFRAVCCNIRSASTLTVPVLVLILAPGSLTEVLRWSLAAGEPASFDHVLVQRPRSSPRLKYRPEPVTPLNSVAGIHMLAVGGIDVTQERDLNHAVHAVPSLWR